MQQYAAASKRWISPRNLIIGYLLFRIGSNLIKESPAVSWKYMKDRYLTLLSTTDIQSNVTIAIPALIIFVLGTLVLRKVRKHEGVDLYSSSRAHFEMREHAAAEINMLKAKAEELEERDCHEQAKAIKDKLTVLEAKLVTMMPKEDLPSSKDKKND